MYKLYAFLCFCALTGGCSTPPADLYQIQDQATAQGQGQGSRLIESSGNAALEAQTAKGQEAPRLIKVVAPKMPREAIAKGIEGSVDAELLVDASGKVSSVIILRSPDALLSEAIVQAMKQWVFSPPAFNGTAKSLKVRQTYVFRVE